MVIITSCGKIFMFSFGLRNPKEYSNKDILKEARKQKIPKEHVYVLDTSINHFFNQLDTTKLVKSMYKNHIQPAQVLYYDSIGNLMSFHINCYAHGYRSKWNYYGAFDQFPPETAAPADTLLPLNVLASYIKTIDGESLTDMSGYDYYIIVYFNRNIRARGKRLVKEVKKNLKLNSDKKIKIIYVNSDQFWYHSVDVDYSEI